MLLIYSPISTPRLRYVLQTIFDELIPCDFMLTNDRAAFVGGFVAKLNYSNEPMSNTPTILPHGLLSSIGTAPIDVQVNTDHATCPLLFANDACALGFDVMAAVFYLLSRYEEYNHDAPFYDYKKSIAFTYNFLKIPIVHHWCELLKSHIEQYYPHLTFKKNTYSYIHTFDVDYHFAYLGKPWYISFYRLMRERLTHHDQYTQRREVLSGKARDPWYNFLELNNQTKSTLEVRWFFHIGTAKNKYDNSLSADDKRYKQSLETVASAANTAIGLHPSFASNADVNTLKDEKLRLERLLQKKITTSRQHFLYNRLPNTLQRLASLGIEHDYSMGYSHALGYRAGVAQSFMWYDISTESTTGLRLHPFMYMDTALCTHLNLNPDEALDEIAELARSCRGVGGTFISLWHNSSLGECFGWQGWQAVHQKAIQISI